MCFGHLAFRHGKLPDTNIIVVYIHAARSLLVMQDGWVKLPEWNILPPKISSWPCWHELAKRQGFFPQSTLGLQLFYFIYSLFDFPAPVKSLTLKKVGESKHGGKLRQSRLETRRVQGSWKGGRKNKPKMGQNGVVGSMSCTRHLIQCGVISVHIPSLLCRRIEIPKTKGRKTKINFSLFYPAMSFPLFISEAPPDKIRVSIMHCVPSKSLVIL